jgi:RimJ/RimL family protein N-acetyltransferase
MKIQPTILDGRHVRLEPLELDHLDGLAEIGLDQRIWRWNPHQVRTRDDMREYIEEALRAQQHGEALPFAIMERDSGLAVGSTRFGNIDPVNRRVEIGWTWLTPSWQRTALNTEAKYLMLSHAFDTWGCARVEFKTDAMNDASRHAILRIGANEEGTLRKHMLTSSGRWRDSVYYSILDTEWPAVRESLKKKLEGRS